MTIHCASVDGPPLRLINQVIYGDMLIVAQPTYGRFLFTAHNIEICGCHFFPDKNQETPILQLSTGKN